MRRAVDFILFLEDREMWTFGYGPEPRTHDCARFVCAGAAAASGVNPLDRFPGRWTTEIGAARVIRRVGGLSAALDSVLSPIAPAMARRGDIGMVDDRTLVLVEGDTVVGLTPERGLFRLPRAVMTQAWSSRG